MHYVLHGAREGRDPSASFSTRGYLLEHPQVAAGGVNPFEHSTGYSARGIRAEDSNGSSSPHPGGQTVSHLTARQREDASEDKGGPDLGPYSGEALAADCRLLRESGLFDLEWYRARAGIDADVDAIEHYLVEGWRAGLEPNAGLEGTFLYSYFSSAGRHAPPAITFLQLRAAGAPVYATAADAEQWAAVIRNSDLFDAADYAASVRLRQGLDPALHYLIIGEHLEHAPSDGFDPVYYRVRYPDIAQAGVLCLGHYLTSSRGGRRRPISVG